MFGLRRPTLLSLLTLSLIFVPACTCGSGPYDGDYFDGDRPTGLLNVKFKESEKGDPKVIGCSDGQREAFADVKKHTRIAGCMATWDGSKSLREKGSGKACGDDGTPCGTPADACATGWHVCGSDGHAKDLKDRVGLKECAEAGPGRFNAGMSHGQTDELCPPKPTDSTVFPCHENGIGSEPVCCGNDCQTGKCKDGVWPGKTRISRGTSEGCGALTSEANGGVLCCSDGDTPPGGTPADASTEAGKPSPDQANGSADAKSNDAKASTEKSDAKSDEKSTSKAEKRPAKRESKPLKVDEESKAAAPG